MSSNVSPVSSNNSLQNGVNLPFISLRCRRSSEICDNKWNWRASDHQRRKKKNGSSISKKEKRHLIVSQRSDLTAGRFDAAVIPTPPRPLRPAALTLTAASCKAVVANAAARSFIMLRDLFVDEQMIE
mmetsp:Transcript_3156/g.5571  ORF Transcript_3156/g.5571 Transcript_3156/m.5571 type:complete len:128 (+) Transcript_3156:654-1037(+)